MISQFPSLFFMLIGLQKYLNLPWSRLAVATAALAKQLIMMKANSGEKIIDNINLDIVYAEMMSIANSDERITDWNSCFQTHHRHTCPESRSVPVFIPRPKELVDNKQDHIWPTRSTNQAKVEERTKLSMKGYYPALSFDKVIFS